METSIQALELLEVETLAYELQHRMGRELTRQERVSLTIACAYSEEGRAFQQSVLKRQRRPS